MPLYTKEEIIARIKRLDEQIEKASEMSSYSVSDGQGSQSVSRVDIKSLLSLRAFLINELQSMTMPSVSRLEGGFNKKGR